MIDDDGLALSFLASFVAVLRLLFTSSLCSVVTNEAGQENIKKQRGRTEEDSRIYAHKQSVSSSL